MKDKKILYYFEPAVQTRVLYFAKKYDIPVSLVIQNIIISHWSRQAAEILANEDLDIPVLKPEFQWEILPNGTEKLVTGKDLFDILVETYRAEQDRIKS